MCIRDRYSIVLRGNGEGYIQKRKRLGLNVHSGDKFIPSEYKLGSREQRLALLRGLMAVSYTHLDVYKRQYLILSFMLSIRILLQLNVN